MKRSSRPRATAELSKSLNHQLNTYALAAGAAGVGLLALAPPAAARIVYTSAHVHIVVNQPPFPLDLNHDGIVDFYFLDEYIDQGSKHVLSACQVVSSGTRGIFCRDFNTTNQIRADSMSGLFAAALRYGAKVRHGDRFRLGAPLGGVRGFSHSKSSSTYWFGPWVNGGKGVKNRYLGLKFKIKGRFHFGWARINVSTTKNDFTATLTGYAYETVPGKAIVAGKTKGPDVMTVHPASLGHLAAGASTISAWRIKQTAATTH